MSEKGVISIAVAVCLNANGELLLLKRAAGKPEAGTWGLIGGKQEAGESSLETCLREAQEEIGIDLKTYMPKYLGQYRLNLRTAFVDTAVYLLHIPEDVPIQLQEEESSDYAWKPIAEWREQDDLMEGMYPLLAALKTAYPNFF